LTGTLKKAAFLLLAGLTMTGLVASCAGTSTTAPGTTIIETTTAPATTVVTTAPPTTVVTTAPPTTVVTTLPPTTVVTTAPPVTQAMSLNGAGSTFDNPLFTQWFTEYAASTGIKVNYQSVGSGAGITDITNGTVDFGASDAIPTTAQFAAAQAAYGTLLTIPVTAGATAIIYNVPGVSGGQLKLTGPVLANIYLGNITKWNDPAIVALNPTLTLPSASIAVEHRSDSSGTTNIFTNYLDKISTQWDSQVGTANSVNWPTGLGSSGSSGVAAAVQQTPDSIGYVELSYAITNTLSYAQLLNAFGAYVLPSVASATAASAGLTIPANGQIMITNSSNAAAYPITGFSWVVVYQNQTNKATGTALVNMLWWAIHTGQNDSPGLYYAQLSASAVTAAENLIKTINYQGTPIYTG
jgi:phosphate transport system substrate-binding protein